MKYVIILMLFLSNCFMTYAWYGHLKDFKHKGLLFVVMFSWGVAFFEYLIQVPANRWGFEYYNAVELRTIQEVVGLVVFALFSVFYLRQPFQWNYAVGFVLIGLGAYMIFKKW